MFIFVQFFFVVSPFWIIFATKKNILTLEGTKWWKYVLSRVAAN